MLAPMTNRQSIKPATLVSVSGSPEALTTHLGLLPSSPNVLILPPINVPSYFPPNSPPASTPTLDARELVTTVHASYIQRHAQAEAFIANHPSRGVILQTGWTTLLAECAIQLVDARVCADASEAVAVIKGICDGSVEEIEQEEEVEIEIEDPEPEEKTPMIEEEASGDEDGDVVPVINPRVSQLSHSSSSSSASSRRGRRVSERSLRNNSIDETAELALDTFPVRDSSLPRPADLPRSRSSQSLRESLKTPPPGASPNSAATNSRYSAYNGKGGKRFPVKAVSMENMAGVAGLGLSMDKTQSFRDSMVSARDSLISNRDSVFVTERRRLLEERLTEDRTKKPTTELTDSEVDVILARKRSTLASIASSARSSVPSTNPSSPRTSTQSFDSRSSTPTRMSEEIPRRRMRKVMEKRMVKAKKVHPSLVFPKEDVVLFLQNSETSPTTTMLIDSFSNTIVHSGKLPSTTTTTMTASSGLPSPPLSPTAPPTIVIEQVISSRTSSPVPHRSSSPAPTPKLSLFPSGRKASISLENKTLATPAVTELKKKMESIKEKPVRTKKMVLNSSSSVKIIDVEGSTPLNVQNEIRAILGDTMIGIKKYPTVVQGLALGMGMGLGLINGGTDGAVSKFWAPVLGGEGASSSVDMIVAIGWEKGCERWGQKLLARMVGGLGRSGPAACVSLSYLLSSSLTHLSPLASTYSSQVHAALSGKLLVPQVEEYLSLHPSTRVLIITYEASTIPNANLEPIRELKRILGNGPNAPFKVVTIVGGGLDGEEHVSPKKTRNRGTVSRASSISTVKTTNSNKTSSSAGYRTTPINPRLYRNGSYTSEPERVPKKTPRTVTPPPTPPTDEKILLRRKELAAISDIMIVDRGRNESSFEDSIKKISALLKEQEEFTGSYKNRQEPGADELSSASESDENEASEEEEVQEEEEDEEDETTYSEAIVSVGIVTNGNPHKTSAWSKMSWSRDILGKKDKHRQPANLPGGKAYRLLGMDT